MKYIFGVKQEAEKEIDQKKRVFHTVVFQVTAILAVGEKIEEATNNINQ